jgi:hypothetical protein
VIYEELLITDVYPLYTTLKFPLKIPVLFWESPAINLIKETTSNVFSSFIRK